MAEVAVIGKPDPQRTEIVKAVIVLKSGVEGTGDLKSEIQQMVRQRLSTHAYPREIDFIASLPKTPSGKIQRFVLRGANPPERCRVIAWKRAFVVAIRTEKSVAAPLIAAGEHETGNLSMVPGDRIAPFPDVLPQRGWQ